MVIQEIIASAQNVYQLIGQTGHKSNANTTLGHKSPAKYKLDTESMANTNWAQNPRDQYQKQSSTSKSFVFHQKIKVMQYQLHLQQYTRTQVFFKYKLPRQTSWLPNFSCFPNHVLKSSLRFCHNLYNIMYIMCILSVQIVLTCQTNRKVDCSKDHDHPS